MMHAHGTWLSVNYKKKDIIQQVLLQKKNRGNIYTIASLGCFLL